MRWSKVLDLLVSKFSLSFNDTDQMMRDFFARYRKPFNLYWYLNRRLSAPDNMILSAICNYHGADIVELIRNKSIRLGPLLIAYRQKILFEPNLRGARGDSQPGTCTPSIEVDLLGFKWALETTRSLLTFQAILTVLAIIAYVVGMGLILYGFSVLFLFLQMPIETTAAATTDAPIGLALLCVLVGLAGFFGKAVSNLFNLTYERIKRNRKGG